MVDSIKKLASILHKSGLGRDALIACVRRLVSSLTLKPNAIAFRRTDVGGSDKIRPHSVPPSEG